MDDSDLSPPADTMRERSDESRVQFWFLITGNRWALVALILLGTFLLLVGLAVIGTSSMERFIGTNAIGSLFSSTIIAVVTAVAFVLTVSQIVLSQELGTIGDVRERMDEQLTFRRDLEDLSSVGVSPAEPGLFLVAVIETVSDRARAVADAAERDGAGDAVSTYVTEVVDHGEKVIGDLEGAEFGSFEVLLPVLNYNYAWKMDAAQRLRTANRDAFSVETERAFDELLDGLQLLGPAREYVKSKYLQWEFVNLSQVMLYSAMPALALSAYMLLIFDPTEVAGTTLHIENSYLAVALAFTLALFPIAVLLAFLLRMLTLTKRTLSVGPFVLRETRRSSGDDREQTSSAGEE
ncbi:hypothetical protein G9464_05445 [Halostella sp. JP-L12]|uniref:hypothetical protein n=1 Tax=Halostella TaxID=1843185 RepID=UPI000EF7BCDE|nr:MULTISPECIES: hypothetical protein [Halostella]NHN47041.1 hypothetical protein [Halostella sp. JP-L12]